MRVFVVTMRSFVEDGDGGAANHDTVFRVFATVEDAKAVVAEFNKKRTSAWSSELSLDEPIGFEVESVS